jgi:hypothetical protein
VIRFALSCSEGHRFEGWFASSEAFEEQKGRGALSCPLCGSIDVDKALMTPAVATSRKRSSVSLAAHPPSLPAEGDAMAKLRELRKRLTENADYVGDRFAEEARRIHYDEVEKRGIYGEATSDEARALAEEGIEFHPLPPLPEDHN